MILKILISSLLALSAATALAATYTQDSEGKQIILTNVGNNNSFDTYTKKVKVTNYSCSTPKKMHQVVYVSSNEEINQAIKELGAEAKECYKPESSTEPHAIQYSYKYESHTDSSDYADSAYAELR